MPFRALDKGLLSLSLSVQTLEKTEPSRQGLVRSTSPYGYCLKTAWLSPRAEVCFIRIGTLGGDYARQRPLSDRLFLYTFHSKTFAMFHFKQLTFPSRTFTHTDTDLPIQNPTISNRSVYDWRLTQA